MSEPVMVPSLGLGLMGSQPVRPEDAEHWKAAADGVFTVPTCDKCGTNYWPIGFACYACGALQWSWQPVAPTGTVYTYTWVDQPTHAGTDLQNLAVIQLEGTKGEPVRVPGWVVGVDKETLACDLPVEVAFDAVTPDVAVPYWRPR